MLEISTYLFERADLLISSLALLTAMIMNVKLFSSSETSNNTRILNCITKVGCTVKADEAFVNVLII